MADRRGKREPRDLVAQTIEDTFSRMRTGQSAEQKQKGANTNQASESRPADRPRRKHATARLASVSPPEQPAAIDSQPALQTGSLVTRAGETPAATSEIPDSSNGRRGKIQRGTRMLEMEPHLLTSEIEPAVSAPASQPLLQTPDVGPALELDRKPAVDVPPRAGVLDIQLRLAALSVNGRDGRIPSSGRAEGRIEAKDAEYPCANVFDDGNEVVVVADFPGIERSTLRVWLQGRMLTISGRSKPPACSENSRLRWSERALGTFVRSFRLPHELDLPKASASYRNGLLEFRAPKIVLPQPRRIAVRGSENADR